MKTTTFIAFFTACLVALSSLNAAPKSSAPFSKALQDAEMIASLNPAWSVTRTSGVSMGDFFGDNSLIIVQKANLSEVHVGMMVVYRSSEGELISHKVIAHNGTSLRTIGVANWSADPAPVTEDMLIGAVFAVFHTSGAPTGPVVASNGSPIPTALCKTF
ncbi:S24/S26 family peptidase [Coraliomargarita sp. W4R53]